MKTCPHCRIQVGGDGLYCPLCHTPLAGAADPGGEAPYFPPSPPPGRRAPFGLQLAAFVLLGGSAACLAVDFLLQDGVHLHWSLAVLAAAVGRAVPAARAFAGQPQRAQTAVPDPGRGFGAGVFLR